MEESKQPSDFLYTAEKSPEDKRDWVFRDRTKEFPDEVDLRPKLPKIRNQGSYGACMAFSACCAKEYHERLDYNFQEYFSPKFFYGQRRNKDTPGMYGRDAMKILRQIGVCYEKSCPYRDVDNVYDYAPHYEEAKHHVISHYARISDIESTCHAIAEQGVCLITFPVYKKNDDIWNKDSEDAEMQGGHAMSIVGYSVRDKHFIIRNSWGTSFGDDGYCYYPFEEWGKHWEIWTTVDDDTKIERLPDIEESKCCRVS